MKFKKTGLDVSTAREILRGFDLDQDSVISLRIQFRDDSESTTTRQYRPQAGGAPHSILRVLSECDDPVHSSKIGDMLPDRPRGTVAASIKKLRDGGLIERVCGVGSPYQITPEGRETLLRLEQVNDVEREVV